MGKLVTLLDYGAGNVLSVINAVKYLGFEIKVTNTAEDIRSAEILIFPGVGAFASAMEMLTKLGVTDALKEYIASGRPFLGICLGMQTLFEWSEEGDVAGLGIIPGRITKFNVAPGHSIPHMGWNEIRVWKENGCGLLDATAAKERYYFVHSFVADASKTPSEWILATTDYGGQSVCAAVQRGNIVASQFHPEKSSKAGLEFIRKFLTVTITDADPMWGKVTQPPTTLAKRIIACLDVRSNDAGDIVVTKGDQYDVREQGEGREVRNLGKPVDLAERYYQMGADEITFLNITSFRSCPLKDQPMVEVLQRTSERVYVPLCIGGGIRDVTDPDGKTYSALDVAGLYFRSGADKVSLGSDAVEAALKYIKDGKKTGESSIEQISRVYGNQAVVISVDPKRVYVDASYDKHHTFPAIVPGPNGETHCWYQCTVKGGRETRDIGAYELARACEELGAGEILLNCIDHDGCNNGFETALVADIKKAVSIPVIASSGAGKPEHFVEVFEKADPEAALAAGIFHRGEVTIEEVKKKVEGWKAGSVRL